MELYCEQQLDYKVMPSFLRSCVVTFSQGFMVKTCPWFISFKGIYNSLAAQWPLAQLSWRVTACLFEVHPQGNSSQGTQSVFSNRNAQTDPPNLVFLQLFSEDTEMPYNLLIFFKNSIHCDRPRETAMEETSIYVCGSESPREYTQRVSFPKLGQNLNKQAAEKGFVGEPGRQRKKTLAGSFSNGQGGKMLDGKTEELRLLATIPIRFSLLHSSNGSGQSQTRGNHFSAFNATPLDVCGHQCYSWEGREVIGEKTFFHHPPPGKENPTAFTTAENLAMS